MRSSLLFAVLTLCLVSAWAHAATPTLAIAYFDNATGKEEFAPLSKGLADMLISDLVNVTSITMVERSKLNLVLDELKLSKTKLIDPQTAQKLGKGLAAQYILTGSYQLAGEAFRIDARLIKVDTATVVGANKVEGKRDEFFAMEKELVDLLIDTLNLKLNFSEKGKLRSNQTESFEAWSKYSAGLDASDKGEGQKAQALFLEALQADPNYRAAKNASERLAALYQNVDAAQAKGWSAQFKALNPKSKDFAARVEQLLVEANTTTEEGMKQKLLLLSWLLERDLYPTSIPQLNRVAMDAIALAGRFVKYPAAWDAVLGTCDYFAKRVPTDISVQNMCRNDLKQINTSRKDPAMTQRLASDWVEDEAKDAKLDADNWMGVLARNHQGILTLLRGYTAKAK